jgi:hypothetical protein
VAHTPPAVMPTAIHSRQSASGRMTFRSLPWTLAVAVVLVLAAAGCSGSGPASTGSTGSSTASTADPEADPGASPPTTTASLPPVTGQACGDPHAHVYSPDRLELLADCVTVTGTVAVIRTEKDGDLHLLLQLDPGEGKYLNAKNVSSEMGDLVLEPVCVHTPTQTDAIPVCAGYQNPLPIPALGSHISVTGPWVLDLDHGWQEIHPVFAFNGVGAPATPTPTQATAIPSPAPAPPAAALTVGITAASYGYVAAHTLPGATCTAKAQLPSGSYSQAQGLQVSPTAAADGNVSWTYGTTSRTTKGTGSYTVTCTFNGQSATATAPFTV